LGVPPVALTVAAPLGNPHSEFSTLENAADGPGASVTVALAVAVQPPQVTVTVYMPAEILVAVWVVCGGTVLHRYAHAAVSTRAVPSECPQCSSVDVAETVRTPTVNTSDADPEQPDALVTVTLYVPGVVTVIVSVLAAVLHKYVE
jgi:hypothetical protein